MRNKKKIYDHEYSLIFAFFYVTALFRIVIFPESFGAQGENGTPVLWIIVLNWAIVGLFMMEFWLMEFFTTEGIIIEKGNFRPIKFIFSHGKSVILGYALPWLESLIFLLIGWLMFRDKIMALMFFGIEDSTIWDGLLTVLIMLAVMQFSTFINKKVLMIHWKSIFLFDWLFQGKIKEQHSRKVNEILGKYTNDILMILLISIFILGGIVAVDFLYINTFLHVIIVYLVLFGYNIYYIYRKRKRILWLYCFVGALPFGFIFPAFLPQKSVLEEIK